jgi:hypothetical protein
MEGISNTTIVASTLAIATPLTAILTLLLTRGVDALLKLRKDAREGDAEESVREESEYKFLIAELKAVVTSLQSELKEIHAEHLHCVKNTGILEGRVMQMEHELSTYRKLAQPTLPQIPATDHGNQPG